MRYGALLTVLGLGGALWYALDPARRATVRDKLAAFQRGEGEAVLHDLRAGAADLAAQARERTTGLAERARAYLDRRGDDAGRLPAKTG